LYEDGNKIDSSYVYLLMWKY